MLCWHSILLLNRLQLKHISCFDHLRCWRDLVGVKNKDRNGEKQSSNRYKVKKETRLKSFIELISKRMDSRVKKMAKDKGIQLQGRNGVPVDEED